MSAHRPSVAFSRLAKRDLQEIYRYSEKTWGTAHAEHHESELLDGIRELADFPARGRLRPDFGEFVRSVMVGAYLVAYEQIGDDLTILRIIHPRRDVARIMPSPGEEKPSG
jgi:toxin ParE1/3/4